MILYYVQTSLKNNFYVIAKNIENAIKEIKLQEYESITQITKISSNVKIGE